MNKIKEILEVDFKHVTKKDWDNVLLVDGDEGYSKSTLGLHIKELWSKMLYGEAKPEEVKFIALDMRQFAAGLRDIKRYELLIYDEAGDLSNLRVINKFNYQITKAYQVIRGLNLFTILILPSMFDLNPFFTKRRARGLFHCYKRGKVAFWGKKKLRKIVSLNQYSKLKNVWRVKYDWVDTFPKYKGVLLDEYQKKKEQKINETKTELYAELYPEEHKSEKYTFVLPKGRRDDLDYGKLRDSSGRFRLPNNVDAFGDFNNYERQEPKGFRF